MVKIVAINTIEKNDDDDMECLDYLTTMNSPLEEVDDGSK